jgi:phosphatidylserine decarboxylase
VAIKFLYSSAREGPVLSRRLSAQGSSLLGYINYETILGAKVSWGKGHLQSFNINLDECVDGPARLNTTKKVFERKIRFWECRPMPDDPCAIVSPSDSRVIPGSFCETSSLFLKDKFFTYDELLGCGKREWLHAFSGNFAVFRLTPEKYHYNHTPVAERLLTFTR